MNPLSNTEYISKFETAADLRSEIKKVESLQSITRNTQEVIYQLKYVDSIEIEPSIISEHKLHGVLWFDLDVGCKFILAGTHWWLKKLKKLSNLSIESDTLISTSVYEIYVRRRDLEKTLAEQIKLFNTENNTCLDVNYAEKLNLLYEKLSSFVDM